MISSSRAGGGPMSFKTDQLRYFVTVAEEGQITRAAQRLYIAQPALSQAISQLEAELGLRLLERHPRGVRLTPAGETFLAKARAVVDTEREVELTAQALARAARGAIEVGFVGPPPTMLAPEMFDAFNAAHADVEIAFRELPFPRGPTRRWLEDVDLALCQRPDAPDGIEARPVRMEPRAVVVPAAHRLAGREEVGVEDVLGERFVSYHPSVQREWAGFHTLDDHRGGPPRELTADNVSSSLEMLGRLTSTQAVTVLPAADARLVAQMLPGVVAIELLDAAPATISLVWDSARAHPLAAALASSLSASTG